MIERRKRRRLVQWHTAAINDFASNIKTARNFVNGKIHGLPRNIARDLITEYVKRYDSETAQNPTRAANIYLREKTKQIRAYLQSCPFDVSALHNDDLLEMQASAAAQRFQKAIEQYAESDASENYADNIEQVYKRLLLMLEEMRIEPPLSTCDDEIEKREAVIVRLTSEQWWLRRFMRLKGQINEHLQIMAGYVRKGRQAYASNICVREWEIQQQQNAAYLEMMELVNEETAERMNLSDIAQATTANPEKRRIELMVRCRGLEDLADDFGYEAFFITWTAPSKYHPNSRKYNGAQPNETQRYLCNQWAKARAAIGREKIKWFGVRVAEPHADACPHWHMLVFVHPGQKAQMQEILIEYATEHDYDELRRKDGTHDISPRFTIEEIDRSKGSATGYIAKYISKNIAADNANSANLGDVPDFETQDSLREGIKRVVAWANRWRIRQFQFFGAAKVTVWRECRRLKSAVEDEAFEKIRSAADHAKWAEFTKLVKTAPLKLQYQTTKKNEFNEPVKRVSGLLFGLLEIVTREARYRLERRKAQQKNGDSRFPWSPVNNCTEVDDNLFRAAKNAGIETNLIPALARGSAIIDGDRGFKLIDNELRIFT